MDQISLVTDKYVSNRGTPYDIIQLGNGQWEIHMRKGGKRPAVCKGRYTSFGMAEKALIKFLAKTDRMGWAIYPGKETR